jgi:hypothetical protein
VRRFGLLAIYKKLSEIYVIYDKVSPCYDMAAVLFDLHHKDGTNYNVGILEVRKYTGEIQY